MIWPMSIIMKALTSTDDAEISDCLHLLALETTHADMFYMARKLQQGQPISIHPYVVLVGKLAVWRIKFDAGPRVPAPDIQIK